jgi:hypothetical protein
VSINGDNTYSIEYDNGDYEGYVPADLIATTKSKERNNFLEGDRVEANYKGIGKWYKGKISRVLRDGTYDINYDDGEKEFAISDYNIKIMEFGDRSDNEILRVGDRIKGKYKNLGNFLRRS